MTPEQSAKIIGIAEELKSLADHMEADWMPETATASEKALIFDR